VAGHGAAKTDLDVVGMGAEDEQVRHQPIMFKVEACRAATTYFGG
jgi:hypothetical protein